LGFGILSLFRVWQVVEKTPQHGHSEETKTTKNLQVIDSHHKQVLRFAQDDHIPVILQFGGAAQSLVHAALPALSRSLIEGENVPVDS
jgi:hypothetical protein